MTPQPYLRIPPEIRLMINKLLLEEALVIQLIGNYPHKGHNFPCSKETHPRAVVTSHSDSFKPDTPDPQWNPWALPRVCRLYRDEISPMLAAVDIGHIKFDFYAFTIDDMMNWMSKMGRERIERMRKFRLEGYGFCKAIHPLERDGTEWKKRLDAEEWRSRETEEFVWFAGKRKCFWRYFEVDLSKFEERPVWTGRCFFEQAFGHPYVTCNYMLLAEVDLLIDDVYSTQKGEVKFTKLDPNDLHMLLRAILHQGQGN